MESSNELRITNYELRIVKILCLLCFICSSFYSIKAQSTNQNFPTPIITNEISGNIPARDIGDARLTSYFYVFNATQGDVFINVVTTNLNGDMDIFTADNLRPLAKITIYADASDSETGRVVYLRQPTKLILRIEGRTPNDNAAAFRIKFAGSFAPAPAVAENADSEIPTVKSDNQTDVRVNSVGTIIEIKPKPMPKPKETVAETKPGKKIKEQTKEKTEIRDIKPEPEKSVNQTAAAKEKEQTIVNQKENKATVVVAAELPKKETTEIESSKIDSSKEIKESIKPATNEPIVKEETIVKPELKTNKKPKTVKSLPASALTNIRLIVLFKDGSKIERPMSDVLKVGVDKGVLTIISKDGTIGRYSILDVEKMTIE